MAQHYQGYAPYHHHNPEESLENDQLALCQNETHSIQHDPAGTKDEESGVRMEAGVARERDIIKNNFLSPR